jgi:hypothetical protein
MVGAGKASVPTAPVATAGTHIAAFPLDWLVVTISPIELIVVIVPHADAVEARKKATVSCEISINYRLHVCVKNTLSTCTALILNS